MPGGAVWNCAEYLKNKLQRARFSIQAKRRQVFPAATIVGYNWYTVDIPSEMDSLNMPRKVELAELPIL